MKKLPSTMLLSLPLVLGACSASGIRSVPAADPDSVVHESESRDALRETVLLVSLDDGTVVRQTIRSTADLCFKQNSVSSTICLTQGEPVLDPITKAVIGFEMIEERIDLVASSN